MLPSQRLLEAIQSFQPECPLEQTFKLTIIETQSHSQSIVTSSMHLPACYSKMQWYQNHWHYVSGRIAEESFDTPYNKCPALIYNETSCLVHQS